MKPQILVVEDSPSIREFIVMTLRPAGYRLIEAQHGREALQRLDGTPLALIISDVNMPQMNGIEFLQAARRLEAYRDTPAILLTTESGAALREEGRAAGANDWVVKPFQPTRLLELVRTWAPIPPS